MGMNSNIIPVITLKQPWASWIMWGWKKIETRTHNKFNVLGDGATIGIHAGLSFDDSDYVINNPYLSYERLIESQIVPKGVILGTVKCYAAGPLNKVHEKDALIECSMTTRQGLFLEHPFLFSEPIPEKGELSIWYYDLISKKKVKKPKLNSNEILF